MNEKRIYSLDLMRFIGVLLIILAHTNPPEWLFNLRNFGVPLLVITSALSYSAVYKNRKVETWKFYKKRLKKLIFPAWIFLTFFFLAIFIALTLLHKEYPFSIDKIISSYLFYKGIGFLWILRVYIILALITPFAIKINSSSISDKNYFIGLIFTYIFYELVLKTAIGFINEETKEFFNLVIFVVIPYAILYLYGMRLKNISDKQIIWISIFSFSVFLILMALKYFNNGYIIATQEYKYPPTAYYLSYALFWSNITYLFCKNLSKLNNRIGEVIKWLSTNSLWIYLWHILALYGWNFLVGNENINFSLFIIKTTLVLAFAIFLTRAQIYFSEKFISNNNIAQLFR